MTKAAAVGTVVLIGTLPTALFYSGAWQPTADHYRSLIDRLGLLKEAQCLPRQIRNPSEVFPLVQTRNSQQLQYFLDSMRNDEGDEAVKKAVNTRHKLGWVPLHIACINGDHKCVDILLDAGANPDEVDEYRLPGPGNRSPNKPRDDRLTNANHGHHTFGNTMEIMRIRINEFSKIVHPQTNTQGFTPLHYAVLSNEPRVVESLLAAGADPTMKDDEGHQALAYAEDSGVSSEGLKIAELLRHGEEQFLWLKEARDKELRRKYPLEQRLREDFIGQLGPIQAVSGAIRRRENGWHDEDHPLVFLFLGSSGIGKTELAKRIANYYHKGDPKGFIRIDMSEFQTRHEVAKFIGSPPGYVGHEEGGQLTEKLRQCPNAVVLLDEVEKCHPDILTIMLQLFDEGRLTDGKGQTIDCKDAVFVMTSNLASDHIAEHGMDLRRMAMERKRAHFVGRNASSQSNRTTAAVGTLQDELNKDKDHQHPVTGAQQQVDIDGESAGITEVSKSFREQIVMPILKAHFQRDEFLGRIDEILYFLPFSDAEVHQLVTLELDRWNRKAAERHGMSLTWDPHVVTALADDYNVHYGARSIKHAVGRRVINQLAHAHEMDVLKKGSEVHIYLKDDKIHLRVTNRGDDGQSGGNGGFTSWFSSRNNKKAKSQPVEVN
eukprot:Clim_evm15s198 gene=Clim_evmTU15s198